VDFSPFLEQVNKLTWVEGERYVVQDDGNVLCVWVDSVDNRLFRLATIRRSSLPLIEEGGSLNGLGLSDKQGLYEPVHVQVFPANIIGVEFNFYGPRPSRLPSYLRQVIGPDACPTFTLDPLLRQDVMTQLNRLGEVRVLELAIRPAYASAVAEADQDLGAAFRAASRVGTPQLVTLRLAPEPYGRGWLGGRILPFARALARRDDMRENTKTFTLHGLDIQTGALELVDVLRDNLVSTKRIVRLDSRSRAIDDNAAYAAISEAYAELKGELEMAASANLQP
jgi:hypothetical protein